VNADTDTIDHAELDRFAASAAAWWEPDGVFAALHRLNPVRLGFIRTRLSAHFGRDPAALRPFTGLRLLDIGCGGGLVAEPMSRLGFAVTGIDAGGCGSARARARSRPRHRLPRRHGRITRRCRGTL
jgi:2-polyprenyl-6-hydroxyphenyl methylase/3-demethylubiquinone-9 3-methyltransferase